jgi:hypothetical protein
MSKRWLLSWALTSVLWIPAHAQPVISVRAGLIHFADGLVFLDGQPIEQRPGKFEQMNEGSELRTHSGRAEVLLTPGAFLRVGENSAIRMVSNRLVDTQVRFVKGSVILDQDNPSPRTSLTIIYSGYQVEIGKQGRYRIDSDPAELRVENGEARVFQHGESVIVTEGNVLPFSGELVAQRSDTEGRDSLDQWNEARGDSVAQDNQEAANTSDLSTAIDNWQKDPFAGMGGLGISGYIPPAGYAGALSPYSPWLGSPLAFGAINPYGFGFGGAFGLYSPLLYPYYYPLRLPSYYRSPSYALPPSYRLPSLTGVTRSPVYGAAPLRPITPPVGGARGVRAVGHR